MPEEVEGLRVKLAYNDTGISKEVKNLTNNIKVAESEFKRAGAGAKNFGNTLDGLKAKQTYLNTAITNQKEILNKYKAAIESAKSKLNEHIRTQEELTNKISSAKEAYRQSADTLGENAEETLRLKESYEQLQRQLNRTNAAIRSTNGSIQAWTIRSNNAEAALTNMQQELESTEHAITRQSSAWNTLSNGFANAQNKLKKVGEGFNNVGDKLITHVSAPIVAVGSLATATAMTYEEAMAKIQAQTGATAQEMESYKNIVENIYGNNWGDGYDDIATALANVHQQTDLSAESLEKFTQNCLILRDAFDYDITETTRAANMLMVQFGLSTEDAFDMIAKGAQNGLDKNGDLLDTINEYSVHFGQAGYSAEEFFNMLKNGVDSGAFSVDKLGDAIKEFGIRAKDGSDTTIEGYTILGFNPDEMQKKVAEGGESAKEALQEVATALTNCNDVVKQNTAGVDLFGTMWEDLGVDAIKALTNINGEFNNVSGTMKEIDNALSNTSTQELISLKRDLAELGIQFGQIILPYLKEGVGYLSEWLSSFSNLDKGTQELIVKGGAFLVVLGPLIKGIGGVMTVGSSLAGGISSVTGLISGAGGLTAAVGGVVKAVGAASVAAGPWVIAIGGIVAALGLWWKHCQKVKERQEALYDTMEKTYALQEKGIGIEEIGSAETEQKKLAKKLEAYDQLLAKQKEFDEKTNELTAKAKKLEDKDSDSTDFSEHMKLVAQMDELNQEIQKSSDAQNTLKSEINKTKEAIEQEYGSVDVAREYLKTYNDEIKNTRKEKELQSKITDANVQALNQQANSYLATSKQIKGLVKEYDELQNKENKDEATKERLKEIQAELNELCSNHAVVINDETGKYGLNLNAINREIEANDRLGNIKKSIVNLWVEGGNKRVAAQIKESQAIIATYQKEIDTLNSMNGPSSAKGMLYDKMSKEKSKLKEAQKLNSLQNGTNLVNLALGAANTTSSKLEQKTNYNTDWATNLTDAFKDVGAKTTEKSQKTSAEKLQEAIENFETLQKLEKIALQDETAHLLAVKAKYAKTAEDVYTINEYIYSNYKSMIERKKALGKLSASDEIKLLENGVKNYAYTETQKAELSKELLDKKVENSLAWIEKEKFYNRLSLEEEKAAYTRIKEYCKDSAEYREEMNKKIYTIEQEIAKQRKALVKNTAEANIKAKEKEYNAAVELIEKEKNAKIEAYQKQIEALEAKTQAEDDAKKEAKYQETLEDLRDRMGSSRTQEEFLQLKEQYDNTKDEQSTYYRDKEVSAAKEAIQEKIKAAQNEADVAKKIEAEKLEAYKEAQNKIAQEAENSENTITDTLQKALKTRESLFAVSLGNMLASLTGLVPQFQAANTEIMKTLTNAGAQNLTAALAGNATTNNTSNVINNNYYNATQTNNMNVPAQAVKVTRDMFSAALKYRNRARGKV